MWFLKLPCLIISEVAFFDYQFDSTSRSPFCLGHDGARHGNTSRIIVEQIVKWSVIWDTASVIHSWYVSNDSCPHHGCRCLSTGHRQYHHDLIVNKCHMKEKNNIRFTSSHWKSRVIVETLSSLVVTTTFGATSDAGVGIITTFGFQWTLSLTEFPRSPTMGSYLTHGCLVTSYGVWDLGHHWLR